MAKGGNAMKPIKADIRASVEAGQKLMAALEDDFGADMIHSSIDTNAGGNVHLRAAEVLIQQWEKSDLVKNG